MIWYQKYNLDFKQRVAFNAMVSSFLLKLLEIENITEESSNEDLVIFLSGMGGTGESELSHVYTLSQMYHVYWTWYMMKIQFR